MTMLRFGLGRVSFSLLLLAAIASAAWSNPSDLLSPKTVRAEALRDAAWSTLRLRQAPTVEGRSSVLSDLFDGNPQAGPPLLSQGRYQSRHRTIWSAFAFGQHSDPGAGVTELWLEDPQPSLGDYVQSAVAAAFGPFHALLDYAWGGRWTGTTTLRAWPNTQSS